MPLLISQFFKWQQHKILDILSLDVNKEEYV